MANKRVFYACKGVAFKDNSKDPGSDTATGISTTTNEMPIASGAPATAAQWKERWIVPRGVQSVDITTNFNLEEYFQLGQLGVYDQVEEIPEVELSISRILDGTCPLYLLASKHVETDYDITGVATRNKDFRSDIALHIYDEASTSAKGTEFNKILCSGMYLQSVSYSFGVDDNGTEELTFVGNNKYLSDTNQGGPTGTAPNSMFPTDIMEGGDEEAIEIDRRWTIKTSSSKWPSSVADQHAIQTISMDFDLGREDIKALGKRDAYHRFVSFPIEVSCSIETIAASGVTLEAIAEKRDNTSNEEIKLVTEGGLTIDLGTKNRLTSVDYGGADTGGGNDTITYNYRNFNDFKVSHYKFPNA